MVSGRHQIADHHRLWGVSIHCEEPRRSEASHIFAKRGLWTLTESLYVVNIVGFLRGLLGVAYFCVFWD